MALQNGVLVHGPTAWGCAVRDDERRAQRRVRSQAAPRAGRCGSGCRSCAGRSRLPRRSRFSRRFAARSRRRASRSSGRACSARFSALPSPRASLRRSKLSAGTREVAAAGVAFLPAALALRGPDLAAYHGAEHISIGTYENGGTPAPKEHPRCGSQLIAPMVASSLAANVVAAKAPAGNAQLRAPRRDRGRDRGLGRGLLLGRSQPAAPARTRARATRLRAPAPPLDGRALGGAARGRERRPRRLPRARAPRRVALQAPLGALPIALMVDLENTLLTWLPIVFFGIVILLLLYTLRFMPRAKPAPVVRGSQVEVSWDDVAGLDEAKEELVEVVEFLRDRKRFERLGARVPRGILLHGPPGTGKTLVAKAVASASGANFYSQSASSFVEMFAGLGAARIRKLFEEARKHAPSIVFIDELDAVGTARIGGGFHREHDQTLNQLLVELDGFNARDEVVVMAASNRLQDLDPALLRPGRFDRQVLVAAPDVAGREAILSVHTRDKPLASDVDLGVDRPADGRAHRRRSREPLQRGGDPRGPRERPAHPPGRLRLGDGPHRRRAPAAARRLREGEAHPGLPRGRARGHVAPRRRPLPRAEGHDRLAWTGARLHAQHAGRGSLHAHARGVRRPHEGLPRRPRCRGDRLRTDHERRSERPRACDRDRPLDGLRVRHVRGRALADDARGQLRALRGDEASSRLRAGTAHRSRVRGGEAPARTKHRSALDRVASALLEKETLDRSELEALLADIVPESHSSETVGTVRALPMRD